MNDLRMETGRTQTGGTTRGRRAARSSHTTLPPQTADESLAAALDRIAGIPGQTAAPAADDTDTPRLPVAHQYSA